MILRVVPLALAPPYWTLIVVCRGFTCIIVGWYVEHGQTWGNKRVYPCLLYTSDAADE